MAFDDVPRFLAVGNYTSSGRVLGTTYTAGVRRRMVIASLKFASGTAASATYSTTIAKTAISNQPVAAFTATETLGQLTAASTVPVTFVVDPAGSYNITAASGAVAIASWIEVDL